jgi:membrane-associated phospholipid phosphatase
VTRWGTCAFRACALLAAVPCLVVAQERDSTTAFVYTRPPPFRAITGIPKTLGITARESFRPRHLPVLLGVTASTLALMAVDEPVLHETRRLAGRVGLPPNHPSANVRLGAFKLALPTTVGSGLYFLGDGLTSVAIAAGFAVRGTVANDMRARRTASEVIEALLASGTVSQMLKHVAGRQTPSEATVPRGRWRPFASLHDYSANVPAYDAFPSGHLTTTMAVFTVLAQNYPEHRFIRPVAAATMGTLAFTMVNNGVHWASDYPLALAIGGAVGNVVVDRGRSVVKRPRHSVPGQPSHVQITPLLGAGFIGAQARW